MRFVGVTLPKLALLILRKLFVAWALFREKQLRWVEMMIESGVMLRRFSEEDIRATREQVRQADAEGRKNLEQGLLVLLDIVPDLRKKLTRKATRKGIEKGIEQGVELGLRNAILSVLRVRKMEVRPEHQAKIDACNDLDILRRWHERAVCAAAIDDVFT